MVALAIKSAVVRVSAPRLSYIDTVLHVEGRTGKASDIELTVLDGGRIYPRGIVESSKPTTCSSSGHSEVDRRSCSSSARRAAKADAFVFPLAGGGDVERSAKRSAFTWLGNGDTDRPRLSEELRSIPGSAMPRCGLVAPARGQLGASSLELLSEEGSTGRKPLKRDARFWLPELRRPSIKFALDRLGSKHFGLCQLVSRVILL
mmetsp:Transcript_2401/g.3677  ORF Transcript_2401/g.3677 Transcript_2401/m.3677 type:complete len:204 (+) Transcript_2401:1555-2166(+)